MTPRRVAAYVIVFVGASAVSLPIERWLFPAQFPPPPQVTVNAVDVLSPPIPGKYIKLRVHGSLRPGCVFTLARGFARWVITPDGKKRYVEHQLLAAVPVPPFDPPVPESMKSLPVAPFFDTSIPLPTYLEPWDDAWFQTAAMPSDCPPIGKAVPEQDRIVAFNAHTAIVKDPSK